MSDARLLVDCLRFNPVPVAAALAKRWSRVNACALVTLAEREGAALWLHRRLRALGVMIPTEGAELLSSAARRSSAQSLRVDEEAFAALAVLDEAGIQAVPLKAAAMRRIAKRVPFADARATSDVDLLVRASDADRAWHLFTEHGYSAPRAAAGNSHHLPGLFGAMGVAVELHVSTTPTVAPDEAWRRATCDGTVADVNGVSRTVPGDTELLWHAVAHAQAHMNDSGQALRLRSWLDASALLAADAAIDWERIRRRIESPECVDPGLTRAWLCVAGDLAGRPLPAGALGSESVHRIDLMRLLAWRLHVSARYPAGGRWARKLADEGARGEARLGVQPAGVCDGHVQRVRHALACRAARAWWRIRR